jgi:hypothetical protein
MRPAAGSGVASPLGTFRRGKEYRSGTDSHISDRVPTVVYQRWGLDQVRCGERQMKVRRTVCIVHSERLDLFRFLLGHQRQFILVGVVFMVTKMISGAADLVRTVVGSNAPAELECHHCKQNVKETAGHGLSNITQSVLRTHLLNGINCVIRLPQHHHSDGHEF